MADLKISQLTSATLPLAGTEVLPIVQSGNTTKVATDDLTVKNVRSNATTGILQVAGPAAGTTRVMTTPNANFTAARTDAAQSFTGDQTLSTGNLIQGTAARGVNFTANTPAAGMTSQLLNWYEQGTFTPVVADAATGGNVAAAANTSGIYTRVGNVVTVHFQAFSINTTGMTAGNSLFIRGLPFTCNSSQSCYGVVDMRNTAFSVYPIVILSASSSAIRFFQPSSGGQITAIPVSSVTASSAFLISLTYTV